MLEVTPPSVDVDASCQSEDVVWLAVSLLSCCPAPPRCWSPIRCGGQSTKDIRVASAAKSELAEREQPNQKLKTVVGSNPVPRLHFTTSSRARSFEARGAQSKSAKRGSERKERGKKRGGNEEQECNRVGVWPFRTLGRFCSGAAELERRASMEPCTTEGKKNNTKRWSAGVEPATMQINCSGTMYYVLCS